MSCQDCFGCIGLKHKRYCILNKQYTPEAFDKLRLTIIEHMKKTGEWGQFFPPSLSPFAYNETAAFDFFPLTEEEAKKRGFRWRPEDKKEFLPASVSTLPDLIFDVSDDIIRAILACSQCDKNYRIIPQELSFYKKMGLPLPRMCQTCRHRAKMKMRNLPLLWNRTCARCNSALETTYAPDRKEAVLCEKCYLEAVYS